MQKKIIEYYARKRQLEKKEHELKRLSIEHQQKTKKDFGLADGEMVDVGTLAMFIFKFLKKQAEKKRGR